MGAMKTLRHIAALGILAGCLATTDLGRHWPAPAPSLLAPPRPMPPLCFRVPHRRHWRGISRRPIFPICFMTSVTTASSRRNGVKAAQPIPIGSLVKPFTALAYAETHNFRFPEHVCTGGNSCWLPKGHGTLGIVAGRRLLLQLVLHRTCGEYRGIASHARSLGASVSTALEPMPLPKQWPAGSAYGVNRRRASYAPMRCCWDADRSRRSGTSWTVWRSQREWGPPLVSHAKGCIKAFSLKPAPRRARMRNTLLEMALC